MTPGSRQTQTGPPSGHKQRKRSSKTIQTLPHWSQQRQQHKSRRYHVLDVETESNSLKKAKREATKQGEATQAQFKRTVAPNELRSVRSTL